MFNAICSFPVNSIDDGVAQTEFEYKPDDCPPRAGFFYADGQVTCVQVFTDLDFSCMHDLRHPPLRGLFS